MNFGLRSTAVYLAGTDPDRTLAVTDQASLYVYDRAELVIQVIGADGAGIGLVESGAVVADLSGADSAQISDDLSYGTSDLATDLIGVDSVPIRLVLSSEVTKIQGKDSWISAPESSKTWTNAQERENG